MGVRMTFPPSCRHGDIRMDITIQTAAGWTDFAGRRNLVSMARLTIRIDLDDRAGFGPGKARLLELIEETGSIRQAAAAMDMSYRRAWLLLRETEALTSEPVVAARTGGKKGGGTSLTTSGRALVECYRAIETEAGRSTDQLLDSFAGMANLAKASAAHRKKMTRRKSR
jgi:molybdate transport system regulatory protein